MQNTKRAALRFTAGLLLVSNLVVPALALTGTVNSGSSTLRVRSQASTNSQVLTTLDHGAQVNVLSTAENGWYEIAFGSETGYVSGEYVLLENVQSAVSAKAPDTAAPQAEAAAAPVAQPKYGKVTTSSLNVRASANTDAQKVGSIKLGRVVEILSQRDGWYQIDTGYVSAEYITVVDAAAATASSKGQEIADYALNFVGYPYVYGGSSPKGFDCSGFTSYIYANFGYSLNRSSSNQLDNGSSVSMSELQPGDLVFFKKSGTGSKRASHVGLYIGGNQFVHASTARVGVIISNMSDAYYTSGFVGGRRLA